LDRDKAKGESRITQLGDSIGTLKDLNKSQHEQDLNELRNVNSQLADLKQDIATKDLRKKMTSLQGELDKYLSSNPKIELETGFPTGGRAEPLATERYITVEGTHAKVDVEVRNMTQVYAENVELWISICDECSFVSEPIGSQNLPGNGPKIRYWNGLKLAPLVANDKTIEMEVPRPYDRTFISVRYACENCAATTTKQLTLNLGRTKLPSYSSPITNKAKNKSKPAANPH
jgi:hypothetical protein